MAVSRRLRFEILRRDGHTCRYCGASAPDVDLTVDHVIDVTLGGGDEPNNLVTACQPCNAGKSSIPADAAAMLFAKALEKAAEARRQERDAIEADVSVFDEAWSCWTYDDGSGVPRDDDWITSIERLLSHGLNVGELIALIQPVMTFNGVRSEWRLFCRRAWDEIGRRQELARRLIEDGEV